MSSFSRPASPSRSSGRSQPFSSSSSSSSDMVIVLAPLRKHGSVRNYTKDRTLSRNTLLPLDDCLYALQSSIPHLTRSAPHRCLRRHGISRLPDVEGNK
ncbi:MAG: hypothetical protein ABJ190_10570, partial [Roseibium sp.]